MRVILGSFVIERGLCQVLLTDGGCCVEQVYGDPSSVGYTTIGICNDRLKVMGTLRGSPECFSRTTPELCTAKGNMKSVCVVCRGLCKVYFRVCLGVFNPQPRPRLDLIVGYSIQCGSALKMKKLTKTKSCLNV